MPDEQVREEWHDGGVRIVFNSPRPFEANVPTRLVIYTTPNGNTIEQTLGCAKADGLDWHFDIQHVAAQVRMLRSLEPKDPIALAVLEAGGLSWPAYRAKFPDNPQRIRTLVEEMIKRTAAQRVRVTLAGHSGGGSFISGFLNAHDAIPDSIERIIYLDANYSFSNDDGHGDKLLAWLQGDASRRLVVIAYDDREVTLNGKKIVSDTGGTWRATQRMLDRFSRDERIEMTKAGDIESHTAFAGRAVFYRHTNPENRILHTAMVGEMNGLLHALALGRPAEAKAPFASGRLYGKFIQPAPGIPPRPAAAPGGAALAAILAPMRLEEREDRIARELLAGNLPESLRSMATVQVTRRDGQGKEHQVAFDVMPDYLALGSDADSLRMPMTPRTATLIAERFGCTLPTTLMVDQIHEAAAVKLEPRPLGEPREAVEQFLKHHQIIEGQLEGRRGKLVSGIKKDIVWSNRIAEKPRRLAIYGWHKLDGSPIQPLTIVHHAGYVDYSHGVRLVKREILLDGKPRDIRDILRDPTLAPLLSNEGVLTIPGYP